MTCIVGFIDDSGKAWMGGDSAGVDEYHTLTRRDPKVFKVGPVLIGFTSSFRMGQLLRYHLKVPDKGREDAYKWMVAEFIPAVRRCLNRGGYAQKSNEVETGGCFLVAAYGRLFAVHPDYQVAEHYDNYQSVGCGADYAFGCLAADADVDGYTSRERVMRALKVASKFSGAVCPPFRVVSAQQS